MFIGREKELKDLTSEVLILKIKTYGHIYILIMGVLISEKLHLR